jgi:hypothetical protein
MTTKTIEIVVSPQGAATVTTKGFAGATCREASKLLEQTLGQRGVERLTAEFYQQIVVANDIRAST